MDARLNFAFKISTIWLCFILDFGVLASNCSQNPIIYSVLNSLQSDLYSLRKEFLAEKVQRISVERAFDDWKSNKESRERTVAFYAWVSPSIDNMKAWETIVFSKVETNIGGAYNNVSGKFVAPIAGAYVFYSNILSAHGELIETNLEVNGENKMDVYSGGKFYGSGSNMAILRLKVGDVVNMAKHGPWSSKPYIHHRWSTFSGYLLSAE